MRSRWALRPQQGAVRQANKLPFQVERGILGIKKEYPSWGAPKIRDKPIREYPTIPPPAVSTVHVALDRNGLKSTQLCFAFPVFERTFREFGLPAAIRTDNGTPSAAPWVMFGPSRLAVWCLRLGIRQQRIKPAAFNFLQQQERFEEFIRVYNHQRPHQALGGAYPAEVYTPSARPCEPPQAPDYPFHDRTLSVTRCGRICLGRRQINQSVALAEQLVGICEVDDQVWQVSLQEYDRG